ncbi:hypothetical protein ABZ990_16575 [Streptomyces sp. NPDC046203]|uniref:hypothetical protein n=1 Tax=Streptomyces sp. NPDC046203 TaxID=3154602 RepID=UPI0034015FC6
MKEEAVARLLRAYPWLEGPASAGHPALAGCEEVNWSGIHGCPAGVPLVLRALLDDTGGPEALRALDCVTMDSPLHIGGAMPAVLPFVIRLAADPGLVVRKGLIELVVFAAMISEPDESDAADTGGGLGEPLGPMDRDRRERAACRAAFAAHAPEVHALLADPGLTDPLLSADDRAWLLKAVEWERAPS